MFASVRCWVIYFNYNNIYALVDIVAYILYCKWY